MPGSMRHAFAEQLRRASLRRGVDPDAEALVLMLTVTGLSQGVLDGQVTKAEAFRTIDYSLGSSHPSVRFAAVCRRSP